MVRLSHFLKRTTIVLLLVIETCQTIVPSFAWPQGRRRLVDKTQSIRTAGYPMAVLGTPLSLRDHFARCRKDPVCVQLIQVYGAVFVANQHKVSLPSNTFLPTEAQVQRFQKSAGIASEKIDGVLVQLQPEALRSFIAARKAARQRGVRIDPRGSDASRRSYADTFRLWQSRVEAGLEHWLSRHRLTTAEVSHLRSLPPLDQARIIFALEAKGMLFGTGAKAPILESVALPGASQHNIMLALDIRQHDSQQVRTILAQYGWFQTVSSDLPHFTYLGVAESTLPTLGLQRNEIGGRVFWAISRQRMAPATEPAKGGRADSQSAAANSTTKVFGSANNFHGTIGREVIVLDVMRSSVQTLTETYFVESGALLHITSGFRSPEAQAKAMYHNLVAYGRRYVLATYGGSSAAAAVIDEFVRNRKDPPIALRSMATTIRSQVNAGVYVSRHLLGRAVDVRRRGTNLAALNDSVRSINGRLSIERDHYHVDF